MIHNIYEISEIIRILIKIATKFLTRSTKVILDNLYHNSMPSIKIIKSSWIVAVTVNGYLGYFSCIAIIITCVGIYASLSSNYIRCRPDFNLVETRNCVVFCDFCIFTLTKVTIGTSLAFFATIIITTMRNSRASPTQPDINSQVSSSRFTEDVVFENILSRFENHQSISLFSVWKIHKTRNC